MISFSSCKSLNSNSSIDFAEEYKKFIIKITSDESVITLERTVCFGTCPIYAVAIYEDGTVSYFGYANVKNTGVDYKKISKESVVSLVSYAYERGYFNLLDNYETKIDTIDGKVYHQTVTDLPSKVTSLRINSKRKIINNYFGGPS
jgi:hypothetical protein